MMKRRRRPGTADRAIPSTRAAIRHRGAGAAARWSVRNGARVADTTRSRGPARRRRNLATARR